MRSFRKSSWPPLIRWKSCRRSASRRRTKISRATRSPKPYNLRTDPFERADTTSNTYYDWFLSKSYMVGAAGAIVEEFLQTFKDYPPRQRAATFTIDQVLEKMYATMSGAGH